MKVLETLGKHQGRQKGIFQCKRSADGVVIDLSVGRAGKIHDKEFMIPNDDWVRLIVTICEQSRKVFKVNEALNPLVKKCFPGFSLTDTGVAAIISILEHEGTLDFYHGPLGSQAGQSVSLHLHAS